MKYKLLVIAAFAVAAAGCDSQKEETGESAAPPEQPQTMAPETVTETAPQIETPPPVAGAEAQPPMAGADPAEDVEPEPVAQEGGEPAPEQPAGTTAIATEDALAVAQTSGCLACHDVSKKLIGPSWMDVAVRYQGTPDAQSILIEKVKTGGMGNWTDVTGGIPMPAYSPRVSDENITLLVDYILGL